jgi:lipopolysaccharide export system protein LptC
MKAREILLLLLLVVIAVSSLWWLKYRSGSASRVEVGFPSNIDYYMADVRITTTDSFGRPAYRLVSPRIEHLIADDSARADSPQLMVFRESAPPWRLQAESGRMPAGDGTIDLQGEVIVTRDAGPRAPATRAQTREVTVNTLEKTAQTQEPVAIEHGNWDIEGVGMRIDLETGQLEMSSVRGVYAPET